MYIYIYIYIYMFVGLTINPVLLSNLTRVNVRFSIDFRVRVHPIDRWIER